jgi:hypothetical protein
MAIAFVAYSRGYRETDSLEVFPEVESDVDWCYRFYFLLRICHSSITEALFFQLRKMSRKT